MFCNRFIYVVPDISLKFRFTNFRFELELTILFLFQIISFHMKQVNLIQLLNISVLKNMCVMDVTEVTHLKITCGDTLSMNVGKNRNIIAHIVPIELNIMTNFLDIYPLDIHINILNIKIPLMSYICRNNMYFSLKIIKIVL